MKNTIFLRFLVIIFSVCLLNNEAKAHPGDSCASAIHLTVGVDSNCAFNSPDTVVWVSFTADSSNMLISLFPSSLARDTPIAAIHKISLYSGSCGSLTLLASVSINLGSDSLPVLYDTGLIRGHTYYVSISKYNTIGCKICNTYPTYFGVGVNGLFSTPMVGSPCQAICQNLVCNWNFLDAPFPGYPTVQCYSMTVANPPCSASSNMRYTSAPCFFDPNGDDYLIESVNTHPYDFINPVGPLPTEYYSFWGDSPSNFGTVVAWKQTISGLTPTATYQFSMYYEDIDNLTNLNLASYPPAALTVTVGTSSVVVTAITNAWQEVCLNWVATSPTVTIQISTTGGHTIAGYDFGLNQISFGALAVTASMGTPTDPLCNGGTGSATVTAGGGISTYTYSWAPNGGSNATGTGLTAGLYTVTVTDHGGCTATASVTITQPTAITIGFNPPNPKVCSSSGSTGTISVTAIASGGTPSYTYHWSTTPAQTSALATGLTIGTYTVIITDSHGCTNSASVSVGSDNLGVTVANAYRCASGTGTLTANVSPGVGPYTYLWTPTSQTTISASGLSTGTYTVLVTDANGCTASASGTISVDGIGVSISDGTGTPTNPCVGYPITLTANVTPGIPAYTYAWSNGATTSSINFNVLAGSHNYTVIVTDANGCTASTFINITSDNLSVTLSGNTVACPVSGGGSNTLITSHATGGSSPYTYNWSPSGGTSSTANLSAGSYTLTVTDLNGCTATASIIITRDNIAVTSTNAMVCTTTGLASLTATATGTYSPFSYVWAPGGQTTATITGLAVGNYTVTATDANGCTASAVGTVSLDNISASISGTVGSNIACGSGTKQYCPTVTGGVSPYVYAWTATVGTTSAGPPPCVDVVWTNPYTDNTLTLTVTDANGCTTSATYTVTGCCGSPNTVYYAINNLTLTPTSLTPIVGTPSMTYSSPTWTFANFAVGSSLAIYGTLDIQTNLTITCSDVLMGTGAKIIVESGCTLTISQSHLHACNDMWDNIDVKPGGLVYMYGSLIENAQQAIYAENGPLASNLSYYNLFGTVFNQDSIGVEVMPYPYTNSSYIGSCTFSSDLTTGTICSTSFFAATTTPVPQIAPNYPNRGAFGVIVRGVKAITIGDASAGTRTNIFLDIDCGVYTEASSTRIVNCDFTDMTPASTPITNNTNIPLAGVYAKGGTAAPPYLLTVGGASTGTFNECHFNECQYGVWARDTIYALIEDNYIEGYPATYIHAIPNPCYGVYLEDNFHTELHVFENNTINDCKYGVGAYNNAASYVYIDTNASITTGSWPSWTNCHGVDMYEVTNTATYWVIDNNLPSVENGIYGHVLNAPQIILNTMTLNDPTNSIFGIQMDGGTASFIKRNTVNGNNYLSSIGIYLNGGNATSQVKCNMLNYPYTGLLINTPQAPIHIEQNDFNMPTSCSPVAIGISLTGTGQVGTNSAVEYNTWNVCGQCGSPATPWATYNAALTSGNGFNTTSNTPCTIYPSANGGFPVFIFNSPGTDTYSCSASFFAALPPVGPRQALSAINDSVAFPSYPQTAHWESKYSVFDYMYTVDSSLVDSSMVIKHFFDSTQNANMGRIIKIYQLLSDSNGVSGNDLATATSLNNSISRPDTAESIYQKVFGIMISMYGRGGQYIPQVASQIATLDSIAPFCPQQYGNGIFFARALLREIDTTNWGDNCSGGGSGKGSGGHKAQQRSTHDTLNNISARVYPNPANTLLNVEIALSNGQIAYFVMYNDMGEKITDMELDKNISTLSINNLPSGMYYYRIIDKSGNIIKADKQMILH